MYKPGHDLEYLEHPHAGAALAVEVGSSELTLEEARPADSASAEASTLGTISMDVGAVPVPPPASAAKLSSRLGEASLLAIGLLLVLAWTILLARGALTLLNWML